MKTKLVPGTEVRDDDGEIAQKITGGAAAMGLRIMQVGIRNKAGVIYRTIDTVGPEQFIDAVQILVSLGFADELEHARGPKYGFDAIFGKA